MEYEGGILTRYKFNISKRDLPVLLYCVPIKYGRCTVGPSPLDVIKSAANAYQLAKETNTRFGKAQFEHSFEILTKEEMMEVDAATLAELKPRKGVEDHAGYGKYVDILTHSAAICMTSGRDL